MARTTPDLVKGLLLADYDAARSPDLCPFILTASTLVDTLQDVAGVDPIDTRLELLERWLSAHCYCAADPSYQARATGGASGTFTGQTGKYLESTRYGQTAVLMDWTGLLSQIATFGAPELATAYYLGWF